MKDKIEKKRNRPRVDWIKVICLLGLSNDYLKWLISKKRKKISINRFAYLFIVDTKGLDFVHNVQNDPDGWSFCYMVRI